MSNVVLAVLGAGQLTLPYAFSQLGLQFGLVALITFALCSVQSLYTLSIYELHFTPDKAACIESYAELVVRVLGPAGNSICTSMIAIYAWGGAVSFLLILKNEFGFLLSLAGEPISGLLPMVLVAALILWPLSSLKDVSSLKKIAPLGCAAAIFITVVVFLSTPWKGMPLLSGVEVCHGTQSFESEETAPRLGRLASWPKSFQAVAATLPLLSFALNSSWAYIPILCTMSDKSIPRVSRLISGANGIILANYLVLSTLGYMMFCESTKPNILDSLGEFSDPSTFQGVLVVIAKAALTLQLTLALPLRFFVARRTLNDTEDGKVRWALAGVLVGSAAALASLQLSLATVLGIVSSICASMIIYILPALVDLRLQRPGFVRKCFSVVNLTVGTFVLVAGLAANVMGVAVGS